MFSYLSELGGAPLEIPVGWFGTSVDKSVILVAEF